MSGASSIPDHHPGYISCEQFFTNRQRLAANRTNCEVLAGPAREGFLFAAGPVDLRDLRAGVWGVRYTGNGGSLPNLSMQLEASGRPSATSLHGACPPGPLDDAVAECLVTAVTPLTIDLALEALSSLEECDKKPFATQWRRRIERATLRRRLGGKRRYEAVDPANRLIASTLEQRWNDAMQRLLELEIELAKLRASDTPCRHRRAKSGKILQLATDFPRLWNAPTHCSA